jgi:hypothetical protein
MRLPFFLFPLLVHMPVYILGRLGAQLVEDEEETQAQNKVVFGLLFLLLIYPANFFFLWALFWYTPTGAFLAATTVYLFAVYHNKLINDNYERCVIFFRNLCCLNPIARSAKRLVAAWRILVGVWAPKRWELPHAALSQYTTPETPKENPWIDRPKTSANQSTATDTMPKITKLIPEPDLVPPLAQEPPVNTRPKRRPPSRRIMRHVLRARAEAIRALAGFFDQLTRVEGKKVHASVHLAKAYGGHVEETLIKREGEQEPEMQGWRQAREVIEFLRARGAKIPTLGHGPLEGEWAALSSDTEGLTPIEEKDEAVSVPLG